MAPVFFVVLKAFCFFFKLKAKLNVFLDYINVAK